MHSDGSSGWVVVDRLEARVDQVEHAVGVARRDEARVGRRTSSVVGGGIDCPASHPSSDRLSGSHASRWLSAVVPAAGQPDDADRLPRPSSLASSGCGRCQSMTRSRLARLPRHWPSSTPSPSSVSSACVVPDAPQRARARRGTTGRRSRRGPTSAATSSSMRSTCDVGVSARRHFQCRSRRARRRVRASSSGSAVVGTRKNSSAPASRALSTARRNASAPKHVTIDAAPLADLVAEDLHVVVRVVAQLRPRRRGRARTRCSTTGAAARCGRRRVHASRICVNAAAIASRSPSMRPRAVDAVGPVRRARDRLRAHHAGDQRQDRPAAPVAARPDRRPRTAARRSRCAACVATCSSMRCQRRANDALMAR